MLTFPCTDVLDVCLQAGKQLQVPAGLDPARVMLAIAAVESGGADPRFAGHNCGPRHESAYDSQGFFWRHSPVQQDLVREYGQDAACSFGPWQMMFCNFHPTLTPADVKTDLHVLGEEFVGHFNRTMQRKQPASLDEIGQIWNTGKKRDDPDYTTKLQRAYDATEAVLQERQATHGL